MISPDGSGHHSILRRIVGIHTLGAEQVPMHDAMQISWQIELPMNPPVSPEESPSFQNLEVRLSTLDGASRSKGSQREGKRVQVFDSLCSDTKVSCSHPALGSPRKEGTKSRTMPTASTVLNASCSTPARYSGGRPIVPRCPFGHSRERPICHYVGLLAWAVCLAFSYLLTM